MFDPSRKVIWHGQLESASKKTPVIYDPGLPELPRGQIFLYNSERDAVVKYVFQIVQPLLKELEGSDRKNIKKELSQKWPAARKDFLREYGARLPHSRGSVADRPNAHVVQPEWGASNDDDWSLEHDDFAPD